MKLLFVFVLYLIFLIRDSKNIFFILKSNHSILDTIQDKKLFAEEILKKNIYAILDNYNYDSLKDIDINKNIYLCHPDLSITSEMKVNSKYLFLDSSFSQNLTSDYINVYFRKIKNKVYIINNGKKINTDTNNKIAIENSNINASFFEEKYFLDNHYTIIYEGENKINDIEVYKVQISNNLGIKKVIYYDKKSYLKVRLEDYLNDKLLIKEDYLHYKKFDKILFYSKVEREMTLNVTAVDTIISLKINHGLTMDNL